MPDRAYPNGDVHQRRENRFGREAMVLLRSSAADDAQMILIAPPHMLCNIHAHQDPACARVQGAPDWGGSCSELSGSFPYRHSPTLSPTESRDCGYRQKRLASMSASNASSAP